jgi:hypothetical protein
MSRIEWIVCERTSRWASALRLAFATEDAPPRVRELRHLAELDAELLARPTALAAIEIHRGNFAQLLAWLPAARGRHARACSIALLDRSLTDELEQVTAALLEAGAQAIASSPRRLDAILSLGQQHARITGIIGPNARLDEAVWASLPWQAE